MIRKNVSLPKACSIILLFFFSSNLLQVNTFWITLVFFVLFCCCLTHKSIQPESWISFLKTEYSGSCIFQNCSTSSCIYFLGPYKILPVYNTSFTRFILRKLFIFHNSRTYRWFFLFIVTDRGSHGFRNMRLGKRPPAPWRRRTVLAVNSTSQTHFILRVCRKEQEPSLGSTVMTIQWIGHFNLGHQRRPVGHPCNERPESRI